MKPFAAKQISREVDILFLPTKTSFKAKVGAPLEEVAAAAGVDINYKCKKGECGTCEVKIDGKWVRACQYRVPVAEYGNQLRVTVRPAAETEKKKPAKFFSPASFVEGVINNGLGVVGFVTEALNVDDEFEERMRREQEQQAKLAARKQQQQPSQSA